MVTSKAYFIILLSALFLLGCVSAPAEQPPPEETHVEPPQETCRNVTELIPHTTVECGEVQYTEEECGRRELNFTSVELPTTHLCMIDGECGGRPISECTMCQKAASRCTMVITNLDDKKSGTWVVKANFTLGNYVFNRDPVSETIDPGENASFDFQHFYVPGYPINTATCQMAIVKKAEVDDCLQVTRPRQECYNVTEEEEVVHEVCE